MLSACEGSTTSTKKIEWGGVIDTRLRAECPAPTKLPNGALTRGQVERYWKRDRVALVKCSGEKSEIIRHLDNVFKRV